MHRRASMPDSVVTKSMHDCSEQDDPSAHLAPAAAENFLSDKVMSWDFEDKLVIGVPKFNQNQDIDDYQSNSMMGKPDRSGAPIGRKAGVQMRRKVSFSGIASQQQESESRQNGQITGAT